MKGTPGRNQEQAEGTIDRGHERPNGEPTRKEGGATHPKESSIQLQVDL